jgi:hypothetical protein
MGETGGKNVLTFVLFRRPFDPSIQMYSARTLPLWSNFMYLANCDDGSVYLHSAMREGRKLQLRKRRTHICGIGDDSRLADTSLRDS